MDISTYVIILGGMLLLSVLLIGGGIVLMRNRQGSDEARIAGQKKELLQRTPEPTPETKGAGAASAEKVEVLRVMRDPVDGRLAVALQGEKAESAADLKPGQRGQLERVIGELTGWLAVVEESGAADPQPAAEPRMPDSSVPFAATLPEEPDLVDMLPFRKKAPPKLSETPPLPRSIAEQINDILQRRLAQSSLAGQTVRLSEEPGGGLKIIVGEHLYQAIDEVAEEDARALIKSAVREWNEKNRLNPNRPGG